MSKSDKVAVEFTTATLQAIATQTDKNGSPLVRVPNQKETFDIIGGYYNALSKFE